MVTNQRKINHRNTLIAPAGCYSSSRTNKNKKIQLIVWCNASQQQKSPKNAPSFQFISDSVGHSMYQKITAIANDFGFTLQKFSEVPGNSFESIKFGHVD